MTEYTPLNKITLNSSALLQNFNYLQSVNPQIGIMPVLKSNAYGHGIGEVYQILQGQNYKYICVDSLYEAYEIYKINPSENVLIMGYVDSENLKVKELPFSYAVWDVEQLKLIKKYQPKAKFHLFVDSGMHREGIQLKDLESFCEILPQEFKNSIEGLMSHFASADEPESLQSENQAIEFQKAEEILNNYKIFPSIKHISASAGLLRNLGNNITHARAGISLYGISPLGNDKNLKPVLELTSKIIQIKEIEAGESLGYNATFKTPKQMKIGILPIGYNDGIDRRLSNKGFVKYRDQFCAILGKVSMNITIIDLSKVQNVKVGDEVIVYSEKFEDQNSIENSAIICQTIPYELLIHLHPSIHREII